MTHDMSECKDMDPGELFMNVIATQQDIICKQLEKSEERWETEFKGIKSNQNKLFDELTALNKAVQKSTSVTNDKVKEALDDFTAKAERILHSVENEHVKKKGYSPFWNTEKEIIICRRFFKQKSKYFFYQECY